MSADKKKKNKAPAAKTAAPAFGEKVRARLSKLLGPLDEKMSFERKTVYRSLRAGAAVLVLLIVFMLLRKDLIYMAASRQARIGHASKALAQAELLEQEGYDSDKIDVIRLFTVKSYLEDGDYESALSLMESVSKQRDLSSYRARAEYLRASAEWENGEYSTAATAFYKLGSYQDSSERYSDCICAAAIVKFLDGDENAASGLITDIADAPERVSRLADSVAGNRADEVRGSEIFTAEGMAHHREMSRELMAALSDSRSPHVAAGKLHTVLATEKGTVLAAGDNSKGQCDVGSWTDIVQVCAGRFFTLGLKKDGTVVAAGDNSYGQCDVSGWTDVTEIAAGAYISVGLKADGTVVACGHGAEALSGWSGIRRVAAGGYSVCAVTNDNTMLCSHTSALMGVETRLKAASICGAVSAGITTDGAMVCSMESVPLWNNIVYVCLSETAIVGIDGEGGVHSFYYHPSDDMGIELTEPAAEIAVSGGHCVILTKAGTVFSFGDNDCGQCDTDGWEM